MKKHVIFFIAAILLLTGLIANAEDTGDEQIYPVRGKVIELLEDYEDEEISLGEGYYIENQYVKVRILEGEYRGKTVVAEHSANAYFSDYEAYRLKKEIKYLFRILRMKEEGLQMPMLPILYAKDTFIFC